MKVPRYTITARRGAHQDPAGRWVRAFDHDELIGRLVAIAETIDPAVAIALRDEITPPKWGDCRTEAEKKAGHGIGPSLKLLRGGR